MYRGGFHLSEFEKDGEQKGGEEKNRQKLEER